MAEEKLSKKNLVKRLHVLVVSLRHPKTPWIARLVIVLTVGLALSPIDLIPDFIPVLGQLDDLLLIPLGISLAWSLIPSEVKEEAERQSEEKPLPQWGWVGIGVTVLLYGLVIALVWWIVRRIKH